MNNINPVTKLLMDAKALINTPSRWTRNSYAKDSEGVSVSYKSKNAVCFCTIGALNRVGEGTPVWSWLKAESLLRKVLQDKFCHFGGIPLFNDSQYTAHADVMKLYDEAIKLSQQEKVS